MTTLAQDKALHIVFCEPLFEGLWNRVFTNNLSDNDVMHDDFHYVNHDDVTRLVKDLYVNFQEVFNEAYSLGFDKGREFYMNNSNE